jgi:hypothetical protein
MADRDTTLPPEIERALHNLVHDRRGTTTWNAARIIIAAALREAREGAEREWHAQADRAMALYAKAKAAESERDALAARVEGLTKSVRGFHDFGEGLSQPFGGRSKHIIMAGEVLIGMAQKALAASPSPSSGRAPVAPAREPYYLADGSAILLPREEVERLRRAAAKVIGAARELVEAAWDGDVAPGQGAWWGVNDGDFQPLANALDMLDTNDGDLAPVAPEGRETETTLSTQHQPEGGTDAVADLHGEQRDAVVGRQGVDEGGPALGGGGRRGGGHREGEEALARDEAGGAGGRGEDEDHRRAHPRRRAGGRGGSLGDLVQQAKIASALFAARAGVDPSQAPETPAPAYACPAYAYTGQKGNEFVVATPAPSGEPRNEHGETEEEFWARWKRIESHPDYDPEGAPTPAWRPVKGRRAPCRHGINGSTPTGTYVCERCRAAAPAKEEP